MLQTIKETASFISNKTKFNPEIGIILGTGLGGLVSEINIQHSIPYNEIPNFPVSTVEGHSGRLILGTLGNKNVVAIEGKGGTQKMLKKCKSREFQNKGVLVKFPKKKQDLRIDLPTVGLKTLIQCKSSGLKGIILKSKKNIFLERNKCISFANKNKMFITVK